MTAWPLNCAAAHTAEMVLWGTGGGASLAAMLSPLLIDTPAVPLRFELGEASSAPEAAAAPQAAAPAPVDAAQLLRVRP